MTAIRPSVFLAVDDAAARARMSGILREAGFKVTAAHDREEDLRRLEREPVDLAVVDLDLPGRRDARELIRNAQRRHPELKALFVAQAADWPPVDDPQRTDTVVKPIPAREFLGCVLELLLRDDGADDRRHCEAELGIAQAHIACLRRRRLAARGNPALTKDLARDLGRATTAARALREKIGAALVESASSGPARCRARPAPPRGGRLRRRP